MGLEVAGWLVGDEDGLLECASDGLELLVMVGDGVGFLDGAALGFFVGFLVGDWVGSAVVGALLGASVGLVVGALKAAASNESANKASDCGFSST